MAPKVKFTWKLAGGAGLFAASTYSAYRWATYHREASEASSTCTEEGACRFNALADKYDQAIGSEETWMGFGILRSWYLKQHVKGNVLEISAGTGRNLPYYNYPAISHLTLTDVSRPMLQRAEDKYFDELRIGYKHPDTRISFAITDAHCMVEEPPKPPEESGQQRRWWSRKSERESASTTKEETQESSKQLRPLGGDGGSLLNIFRVLMPGTISKSKNSKPSQAFVTAHTFDNLTVQQCCQRGCSLDGEALTKFPANSFDTVVDTFGLCSHSNPVQVLQEAARVCKPDGKIVLLEHGRGRGDWMNTRLDDQAHRHHDKWGCWWNRDILHIVQQAGLAVEYVSRWHFGTTYVIIARPA